MFPLSRFRIQAYIGPFYTGQKKFFSPKLRLIFFLEFCRIQNNAAAHLLRDSPLTEICTNNGNGTSFIHGVVVFQKKGPSVWAATGEEVRRLREVRGFVELR